MWGRRGDIRVAWALIALAMFAAPNVAKAQSAVLWGVSVGSGGSSCVSTVLTAFR